MDTSLSTWQALTQTPAVVAFFHGLFRRVGVRVRETGEAFTAVHEGDRILFEPTLDADRVDYTVEIGAHQVGRLAAHAGTGALDAAEQYRIAAVLFTPATAATLRHPVLASALVRRLAGAERRIHVTLRSEATGEPDVPHTLAYEGGAWNVQPGLHGAAERAYSLTVEQALAYQRHVFAALHAGTPLAWVRFALWYRRWRGAASA